MVTTSKRMISAAVAASLAVGVGVLSFSGAAAPAAAMSVGRTANAVVEPPPIPTKSLRVEHVSPSPETYGVGIVVRVHFNRDVPESAREAVTTQIKVSSSQPIGTSGWAWADQRTAVFRPKDFWPANSDITVSALPSQEVIASLPRYDLLWAGSVATGFSTGDSQVITVDGETKQATVVRNGEQVRTMPISLGMPGWETRSGTKVLMEKYEVKRMTSDSIGAEEEYELDVPYAIRLTDSGEFVHAAPWATGRLGRTNGSHGCTNLSMDDAQWLYENHLYGDPVITRGTSRGMESANGAGGVWNVAWSTWKTGVAA